MPITNQSKPGAATPQTELNVGSGYNLLVGSTFKLIIGALGLGGMVNTFKNFQTRWDTWSTAWDNNNVRSWDDLAGEIHTNVSKVSVGETWATISTTWNTETRTWLAASQLITNVTMSPTDSLWSNRTFPWQLSTPWQQS